MKSHCECGNKLWSDQYKSLGVCPDCEGFEDEPKELEQRLKEAVWPFPVVHGTIPVKEM